jgi:hypothetical protein
VTGMLAMLTNDYDLCSDIDALQDATLRRIDEVINQDVEMQASPFCQKIARLMPECCDHSL